MGKFFTDEDRGWSQLMTKFEASAGETSVFVGFLRSSGSHTPKHLGGKGKPVSVAQLAAIHEFGAPKANIPERSFMRTAVDGNKSKLTDMLKKLSLQVLDGKMKQDQALGIVGQFVAQLMKGKISQGVPPPNKPATVKAKGSSHPLVDTGQLLNSIDWEVRRGKSK